MKTILILFTLTYALFSQDKIDDLTLSYTNHRLSNVVDAEDSTGYHQKVGSNPFDYDANGNLIKDSNKDITSIEYNRFNLPSKVTFNDNHFIEYDYNPEGQRIRKRISNTSGTIIDTRTYLRDLDGTILAELNKYGNIVYRMIYVNGELVGRTEYEYDNESSSQILLRHHDRYFLKDHLSNVRVTLKDKRNEWRDDFESETSKQYFLSKHSANTSSPYSEFMEDPSDSSNQVLRLRSNSNSAYTSYVLYVAPSTEYRVRVRVRVNDSGLSHGGIVRSQYDSTSSQISGTWVWTHANLSDIGNWQDVDFTFTTEPNAYKVQFFHGMNHYASGTEKSIDFDNIEIIEVKNDYKLQEDFTSSSGWSTWLAYGNTHPNAVELTEEPGNSSNDIVILRNNTGTTNYSYLISSIKPETRYRIRYRLKRVNSASHYNCVYFNFIDDNGNGGDYYYIVSNSENPEWQTQSREFVSPAIGDTILNTSGIIRVYNGDGIRIHARIHSSDPGGNAEVWFDDIELEEIRDDRHEVIAANDYYPYGMTIAGRTFSGDPEKDKFKYQSKERDAETGYDYFEARLFDSEIGRFLQVDPRSEDFFSITAYASMANSPTNLVDPNGEAPTDPKLSARVSFSFGGGRASVTGSVAISYSARSDNGAFHANVGIAATYGGLGTRTDTHTGRVDAFATGAFELGGGNASAMPLNGFTNQSASGIESTMQSSVTYGQTGVFNLSGNEALTANTQRLGYVGLRSGDVSFQLSNDFNLSDYLGSVGSLIGGDGGDRGFTASFSLSVGNASLQGDVFTGISGNESGLPVRARGSISEYTQQAPGQQALNQGVTAFSVSGYAAMVQGSSGMWSQDLVHEYLTDNELFRSSAANSAGASGGN